VRDQGSPEHSGPCTGGGPPSFGDRMADFQAEPYDPTADDVLALLALDSDMALTDRERELPG
jgi:hypothetical protein